MSLTSFRPDCPAAEFNQHSNTVNSAAKSSLGIIFIMRKIINMILMLMVMTMVALMTMTMKTYLTAFNEVDTVVLYVEANKVAAKNALVIKRINR